MRPDDTCTPLPPRTQGYGRKSVQTVGPSLASTLSAGPSYFSKGSVRTGIPTTSRLMTATSVNRGVARTSIPAVTPPTRSRGSISLASGDPVSRGIMSTAPAELAEYLKFIGVSPGLADSVLERLSHRTLTELAHCVLRQIDRKSVVTEGDTAFYCLMKILNPSHPIPNSHWKGLTAPSSAKIVCSGLIWLLHLMRYDCMTFRYPEESEYLKFISEATCDPSHCQSTPGQSSTRLHPDDLQLYENVEIFTNSVCESGVEANFCLEVPLNYSDLDLFLGVAYRRLKVAEHSYPVQPTDVVIRFYEFSLRNMCSQAEAKREALEREKVDLFGALQGLDKLGQELERLRTMVNTYKEDAETSSRMLAEMDVNMRSTSQTISDVQKQIEEKKKEKSLIQTEIDRVNRVVASQEMNHAEVEEARRLTRDLQEKAKDHRQVAEVKIKNRNDVEKSLKERWKAPAQAWKDLVTWIHSSEVQEGMHLPLLAGVVRGIQTVLLGDIAGFNGDIRRLPREKLTQLHFSMDYEAVKNRAEKNIGDTRPIAVSDSTIVTAKAIASESPALLKAVKSTLSDLRRGVAEAEKQHEEANKQRKTALETARVQIENVKREMTRIKSIKEDSEQKVLQLSQTMRAAKLRADLELKSAQEKEFDARKAAEEEGSKINRRLRTALQQAEGGIREIEEAQCRQQKVNSTLMQCIPVLFSAERDRLKKSLNNMPDEVLYRLCHDEKIARFLGRSPIVSEAELEPTPEEEEEEEEEQDENMEMAEVSGGTGGEYTEDEIRVPKPVLPPQKEDARAHFTRIMGNRTGFDLGLLR